MCGLSSLFISKNTLNKPYKDYITKLILLSQGRGMDATGISVHNLNNNTASIYKEPKKASNFVKTKDFTKLFPKESTDIAVIAHNRLATNGSNAYNDNNQPIYFENIACVQNGIVTNVEEIAKSLNIDSTLDTYALLHLFRSELIKNDNLLTAIQEVYKKTQGENTVIFQLFDQKKLAHITNSGTLYYIDDIKNGMFVSGSEYYIIEQFRTEFNITATISQLHPNQAIIVDYLNKKSEIIENLLYASGDYSPNMSESIPTTTIIDFEAEFYKKLANLTRCKKCLLPHTFPNISFNSSGVCNVCEEYSLLNYKPTQDLDEVFSKYRSNNGSPDCLVAFSGGRDSSYGLHLIKEKYKMNPIAYSYDWGMVTDLARRNQARLCGKLGIEHIWVSADIKLKRENIRKNVEAWIKKPDIGMVPLFMVGDKTYFYHANRVMKNMNLKLIVFCPNNLERTNFKASYCGITPDDFGQQVHQLKLRGKMKLLKYYAKQYLLNPKYINSSISDVFAGFLSYYVMKQDFLYLFDYEKWDEKEIDTILKEQYDWEWDPTYPSSWRIGDGTAPLYNMIYFVHAGFTENDCFRSNQIREGVITREEGLKRIEAENKPRLKEIEDYCKLINVSFVELINAIRKIRYE